MCSLMIPCCLFMLRWRIIVSIRKYSSSGETLLNPLNIQLLGKSLNEKVFPSTATHGSLNRVQMQTLELSRNHLESHDIPWNKERALLPEISGISIPNLLGNNLTDHFKRMATDLTGNYFKLALEFGRNLKEKGTTPPPPINSQTLPESISGWFRWSTEAQKWLQIDSQGPTDQVILLDVETCPQISQFPILACAYGPEGGWYIWLSSSSKDNETTFTDDDLSKLIPLKHPLLVIGHHVAFDRARVRQEYENALERGDQKFLDTLSMHCAVAGLSSQQRGLWQERKKKQRTLDFEEEDTESNNNEDTMITEEEASTEKWGSRSSLNNLSDSLQLHCNRKLDKSVRDGILLKATHIDQIIEARNEILEYCAKDVEATADLFSVLFPKFLKKSPHPVTFAALLEMGSFILPLQKDNWTRYIEDCDKMYNEATEAIELELKNAVDKACTEGLKNLVETLKDPWLNQLDWTVDPIRYTKARYLKDGVTFAKGGEPRPIGNSTWAGKPAWYKKLVKAGAIHVTPRTSIVPLLLNLKWKSKIVHLIPEYGWCIERDPTHQGKEETIDFNGKKFIRIPHPGGRDENVGCLLTKNFMKFFQSGDLCTENSLIERVLEVNSKFSFWTGYRERIREQFVISPTMNEEYSLILPTVQAMGTVTRRAVEKTWLTASNAKEKLVGSELKAMIKAPEGWCFVGADVDSQELWIGSLLGDAQFGWSGSTALGWMTLQGTKSDGTDLHSRTANILGMTRDNAKIFNYGRIYGAGVKYAAQLLLKFNPKLGAAEAAAKASELYHATKGRRIANRRDAFVSYSGGTESFMFNQMEAIARAPISKTPVLSAEISDGLIAENVDDNFITSRVNWVVQSSGVDYLHMLLVGVAYLFKAYKIPGRLALTIHDEVRFLVPEAEKYRAALALQIANLWTRSAFIQAVGVHDLPLSVAFFSAVDIDQVLRKEVHLSCLTPSNQTSIPPGQALDIYKLLVKCPSLGNQQVDMKCSSSDYMYNYYSRNIIDSDNQTPPIGKNSSSYEDEQKYLALLRKQMKKTESSDKPRPSEQHAQHTQHTQQKASSSNRPVTSGSNGKNEFFNRWNNLVNKKQQQQPDGNTK